MFAKCGSNETSHPDLDGAALNRWYEDFADYLTDLDIDALKAADHRRAPDQQRASRALFAAFARVLAERV